jgi:2'-5' RNA ligase
MASPAPERIRAFVAIALEPALAKEVRTVQQRLNSPVGVVRWSDPEHLHLTLQFLGNVAIEHLDNLAAALRSACAHTAPFRLALQGAGCFPNTKSPRVVWVGVQGDLEPLQKLQRQIANATGSFGDHGDERTFQPHLTIGRLKPSGIEARKAGQTIALATVPKLGDWTVHQILLVRSELSSDGARYATLAEVALVH